MENYDSNFLNVASKIICSNVEAFLDAVQRIAEIGPFKKARKTEPGFPIFKPANSEYYQYAYFEECLEWYIRDYLVNAILTSLFNLRGAECLWPEKNGAIHVRFNNESIENIYPFEFIVVDSDKRIGYRYTGLTVNEVDQLLSQYELDKIVIIDWSDARDEVTRRKASPCDNSNVTYETIRYFFCSVFPEDVFPFYLSQVRNAVETANSEIGFQTIPRMSLRYLSAFKDDLLEELNGRDYPVLRYMVLDANDPEKERYKGIYFSNKDYAILDANFKDKGLFKSLLGTESFAKCFVTAEYLYNIFKAGNSFDYTSVISGYLKSIEQLLYLIVKYRLKNSANEEYWIKGNYPADRPDRNQMSKKIRNVWHVKFLPQNESFFDITLTPLIYFLNDNGQYVITDGLKIHKLLLQYSGECRNDHFHKDNINEFHDVECIQNNTLLLIYLILGGCKLTGNTATDYELLGISDDSFDRLFKRMIQIPRGVNKFCIKFSGREEMILRRMFNQEKPVYNENGSVTESSIKFITEDKYATLEDESGIAHDLVIDSKCIPEKVWFITPDRTKHPVEW